MTLCMIYASRTKFSSHLTTVSHAYNTRKACLHVSRLRTLPNHQNFFQASLRSRLRRRQQNAGQKPKPSPPAFCISQRQPFPILTKIFAISKKNAWLTLFLLCCHFCLSLLSAHLQALHCHGFARVECGGIGFISPVRINQIRHFRNNVHIRISHIPVFIRIRMRGVRSLLLSRRNIRW